MNYKEKIQQAKAEKEKNEQERLLQREKEFDEYLDKIRSLKDRIKKLIDIGKELYKNSFPLEVVPLDSDYRKYPLGQLFTEGNKHHMGFYSLRRGNPQYPEYLGVEAGGFCGKFDLLVREDGRVSFVNEDTRYTNQIKMFDRVDDYNTRDLIRTFLREFDTFDKRLHYYVDHLNDKTVRFIPIKNWGEILESASLHTNELREESGR